MDVFADLGFEEDARIPLFRFFKKRVGAGVIEQAASEFDAGQHARLYGIAHRRGDQFGFAVRLAAVAGQSDVVHVIVAAAHEDLVQVPRCCQADCVFEPRIISGAGDGRVLIGIFADGDAIVEVDPEIADVKVE